jgi:CRP-like cAMP-binding protein
MSAPAPSIAATQPAVRRLAALAQLGAQDIAVLEDAIGRSRWVPARRELITEGRPIPGPLLIVDGWAARVRILPDGRRQFLTFLLPGDLIGMCHQPRPLAVSTVITLNDVTACPAPLGVSAIDAAYRMSQALDEAHLLSQIIRLGRLNAEERIGDLLLEFNERLTLAGLSIDDSFSVVLTQEMLADALGLTSVHVNRMLQSMRRAGDVVWKGGHVRLPDVARLARRIGRVPMRVTDDPR